jgi:hypothetical protein
VGGRRSELFTEQPVKMGLVREGDLPPQPLAFRVFSCVFEIFQGSNPCSRVAKIPGRNTSGGFFKVNTLLKS